MKRRNGDCNVHGSGNSKIHDDSEFERRKRWFGREMALKIVFAGEKFPASDWIEIHIMVEDVLLLRPPQKIHDRLIRLL